MKHSCVYADGKVVVPSFFSVLTVERKSNESTPWQDGRQETHGWVRGPVRTFPHTVLGEQFWGPALLLQPVTCLPPASKHWLMRPQNLLPLQAEAHVGGGGGVGRLLNHANLSAVFPEPPARHPFCLALDPPPILNACIGIFPGPCLLQLCHIFSLGVFSKQQNLLLTWLHISSALLSPGLQALLSLGPHLSYPAWPWLLQRLCPSFIAA